MADLATINAAIAAATAGVGLIDKIADQVTRFLVKREAPAGPVEHRVRIERDGNDIVQKRDGLVCQRVTHADLQKKLSEAELRHVIALEKSMNNHHAIWASVHPSLALMVDPVAKAKTEQQVHGVVVAMKDDLIGILDFLQMAGLELDDHYLHIRHLVAQA